MFAEAVDSFFAELTEAGTLNSVLKDLGWTGKRDILRPPKVIQHQMVSVRVPAMA